MKEIKLSKGLVALVDDEDFEELSKYNWYACFNRIKYYARRHQMINGKKTKVYMHRQILGLTNPKIFADHIDGDGLNNQKHNLRAASNSQNLANVNKRKGTSSKYKGVNYRKATGKWQVHIQHQGKLHFVGTFDNEIDGAKAYDKKATELFGEFAKLNFPNNNESKR